MNNANSMNDFNFGGPEAAGLSNQFNMDDGQGSNMAQSAVFSPSKEPGFGGSAQEEEKKQIDGVEHNGRDGSDGYGSPADRRAMNNELSASVMSSVAAGAATAGTTVISLISNMISMKTPEPEDKGQSQSSVAHSSEHKFGGSNMESSPARKHAPPMRQSQLAMAGPSPSIIRKTGGDGDDNGSMRSDEVNSHDEEPEQNQASRNASQSKVIYQAPRMSTEEEMKTQVNSETERRIRELKVVLSADKVVKWWARIPQGCPEVTQPFKDPLIYQQ